MKTEVFSVGAIGLSASLVADSALSSVEISTIAEVIVQLVIAVATLYKLFKKGEQKK